MAALDITNEAHVLVHGYLGGRLVHNWAFDEAGDKLVKEMTYWVPEHARDAKAQELAQGMDAFFRLFAGADFDAEIPPSAGISQVKAKLLEGDKIFSELADGIDEIYQFASEQV